jgi:hypothetical protein
MSTIFSYMELLRDGERVIELIGDSCFINRMDSSYSSGVIIGPAPSKTNRGGSLARRYYVFFLTSPGLWNRPATAEHLLKRISRALLK